MVLRRRDSDEREPAKDVEWLWGEGRKRNEAKVKATAKAELS